MAPESRLKFQIDGEAAGSRARAGAMHTLHGEVRTPVFMAVGTQAAVKSQSVRELKAAGTRVVLGNTYHLMLRPGAEVFRKFGGIHRFMNWDGPVLTDSGGYQIFSLSGAREIHEEGARFRSYLDSSTVLVSPEQSIGMQRAIGSDIMMVLDQCLPSTAPYEQARQAMELTHRWARRSLAARGDSPQALFGIVQGACFPELRRESAEFLRSLPFDGLAIGGLAVGEGKAEREDITEATTEHLPRELPRYLMGVGTPLDILEAVHRGVDMFDCILPTCFAQRGAVFTSRGKFQLRRTLYALSEEALDPGCDCDCCRDYSRAYLHHLIKAGEPLGWQLLSLHNLTFYHRLMAQIRAAILEARFEAFYREKRVLLAQGDEENPVSPPARGRPPRRLRGLALGDYEVHESEAGFSSIRQRSSGEVMHSVSDPILEARALYVEQPDLAARLRDTTRAGEPLVIWDVGLGAATNAMAAIHCFEGLSTDEISRPLALFSFERDLDSLRLACKHASRFPHLRHPAPASLLREGRWTDRSGRLTWQLIDGDFLACLSRAPRPELVFYDPFSFKTDSPLWTPDAFELVYRHCATEPAARTELFTYSTSTAVRAALLYSGFFVASGRATGPKTETTVACTPGAAAGSPHPLLGEAWLERWQRSGARIPAGLAPARVPAFLERILSHPQFGGVRAE